MSEIEEKASVETQLAREARVHAQALSSIATDPAEGRAAGGSFLTARGQGTVSQRDRTVSSELTVGSSCDYATIKAAVAAAHQGDILLIEGGRTFVENVSVPISVTLRGGYDGCDSGSSDRTTMDGGMMARSCSRVSAEHPPPRTTAPPRAQPPALPHPAIPWYDARRPLTQ